MTAVFSRRNAPHYEWGARCDGWRLLDGGDLAVIEERVPPGAGEVRHVHQSARQLFYVLDGTLLIETADALHTLAAGDSLHVTPGTPHRVSNRGAIDARFLVISAPSTRGDRTDLE